MDLKLEHVVSDQSLRSLSQLRSNQSPRQFMMFLNCRTLVLIQYMKLINCGFTPSR